MSSQIKQWKSATYVCIFSQMYVKTLFAEKKKNFIHPNKMCEIPNYSNYNSSHLFPDRVLPVLLPRTSPPPHLIFQLQTHLPFLLLVNCCYLWFQSIAMEKGGGGVKDYHINSLPPSPLLQLTPSLEVLLAWAKKPNHLDDNYKFFARPFAVLCIY